MDARARWAIAFVGLTFVGAIPARAQDDLARLIGRSVAAIKFEIEGRPVTSADLDAFVPIHSGDPLRLEAVRDGESHLISAGRYDDVQVFYTESPEGLTLTFRLTPRHPVDRLEFEGDTGLNRDELDRRVRERYGGLPAREQPENVAQVVEGLLKDEGFPEARVRPRVEETHNPDRATLVLEVQAGARPLIARTDVTGTSPLSLETVISRTSTAKGQPFRRQALEAALADLGDELRKQGYYGAVALMPNEPVASDAEHGLIVALRVDAGPRVTLRWVGPQPPGNDEDYVPMRRQRSVDEDLLEDSDRRVAAYWKREGYKNVDVSHTREVQGTQLVVTMHTTLGVRYRIDDLKITGNAHLPPERVREALRIGPGDPYDPSRIATGILLLKTTYLRRGYHQVGIKELDPEEVAGSRTPTEVRVNAHIDVVEGPDAHIGKLMFSGNRVEGELEIQTMMPRPGDLYVAETLLRDKATLESFYRDKGFENIDIRIDPTPSVDQRIVDIAVAIVEGPQVTVGDIRVVGNRRISEKIVKEQMALKEGAPFGAAGQRDSYRSLYNMGVFRHIVIDEEPRVSGETIAHVIVTVDELPTTSTSVGGGLQGGRRALTASDGSVADRLEFAPRGFFEIGRRNLWGKNRSVDLFTRVAPRLRGTTAGENFLEYRVSGTYREPHAFNADTDALVSVTSEQVARTGFNFFRRSLNAELVRKISPRVNVSGRYALESTRLFDVNITTSILDRLFPQVRLSILSSGVVWDRRNDPVDPSHGTLATVDGELAARSVGSEVGYSKVFLQASGFHALASTRRVVLAGRAEVGFARGFARGVQQSQADGTTITVPVADLPASQRFFAGGSTTVRGFELDRLGVPAIINADGLSNGGNGVAVFNAEVRTTVGKILGREFGVVGFADAGNVFAKASDIDFAMLRAAYGFGIRYNSPLGPVRLDLGFKTHREIVGGTRERGWEYHLNIGEAF